MRLTRAEAQERTRAKVLAAARDEFADRGFRDAKIDQIAARADLTRGAVYSNFPGKRALYFAVLAETAAAQHGPEHPGTPATPRDVLGALARAWVTRLPLATDEQARLGVDLMPEIIADDHVRKPYAQLMWLCAIQLGLTLENLRPGARQVRRAQTALTLLHGAAQLAAAAPGFGEPFTVVTACEHLADADFDDTGLTPHTNPDIQTAEHPWTLTGDGIVAILGLHRLSGVEEALRGGTDVTLVIVTADPAELIPLARLMVTDFTGLLRNAAPASARPRLRIVLDDTSTFTTGAGIETVTDMTETALRVESGRVVLRADGFGACHAAATASTRSGRR
ncbi:TetR/AcrR family transcriptional regulator [Kibdelosporangium phytohabitans]|uniref:TetR family transcriptional regulator n=1 Tax=Kibdelosporangium phytohabitans TaxID=860235 RepID=A0A0N9HXJ6_9PSEU|nr:TetR/AcrR family transcriptional regulator [Kibdelosporangium phytohabitans]ALG10104.1 TetR family transcriptional regulator [Kibdelosporangium phytohabitans]MBE1461088.1 AcrR family transcriptional regulator [Kibdelosporangium phytohabitans]